MSNFKTKWNTAPVLKKIEDGAFQGLMQCADDLNLKSQKLCPKDKGYDGGLVSTVYSIVDRKAMNAIVGYMKIYARRQHYGRWYDRNDRHKNGEQAYFLAQPLIENCLRYLGIIGSEIRKAMSR